MTAQRIIYLIRGLPGSGKSTLGKMLTEMSIAADDWMQNEYGQYSFQPKLLQYAHESCQRTFKLLLANTDINISVCNTFSQYWEIRPYVHICREHRVPYVIIDLFDSGLSDTELAGRSVHAVPAAVIAKMRVRWEPMRVSFWPS